jgi:hypothetical protein
MSKSGFRRVQAFIPPLYAQRLRAGGFPNDDIRYLCGSLRATASFIDNGRLACMVCDPWPSYCPYYDTAKNHCKCKHPCDFEDDSYKPKKTFDGLEAFWEHLIDDHDNMEPRPIAWFKESW